MSGNPFLKDPFWHRYYPDPPLTFDEILANVKRGLAERDKPPLDFAPRAPFTAHQREIVSRCIETAEKLHSSGRTVEALSFLFLPNEIIAFHEGTEHAEFAAIEAHAQKYAAMEAGSMGGKTTAAATEKKFDLIAADILRMHEEKPFTSKREMLEAVAARNPNRDGESDDEAWARRLLRRADLAEIYRALAKSRAPQINRVTR